MSGHGDVRLLAQLGQEEVTIRDFATAQVADTFGLAYLVEVFVPILQTATSRRNRTCIPAEPDPAQLR